MQNKLYAFRKIAFINYIDPFNKLTKKVLNFAKITMVNTILSKTQNKSHTFCKFPATGLNHRSLNKHKIGYLKPIVVRTFWFIFQILYNQKKPLFISILKFNFNFF